MYTELVEMLRCVNDHDESWLVAAAYRSEGRHIMHGMLGCPVCRAQFPIEEGIADFTGGTAWPRTVARIRRVADDGEADEALTLKLAAMLDLTDSTGYVLLLGHWTRLAHQLRALVPVSVLAVNPSPDVVMGDGVSGVRASRVPVRPGSARGAALGDAAEREPWSAGGMLAGAVASVRAGGRVVADASLPLADELTMIAQDAAHWVATREGERPLLQIVRPSR